MRFFKHLPAFLALLVAVVVATIWLLLCGNLPQLSGDRKVAGLHARVSIERDALGVATIEGASRADVSFALGYVHAQERYFAMDLMRRAAAGELSELVGQMALKMDRQRRAFRMRARAERFLAALPPERRVEIAAYRDGVNAGLAAQTTRPWEYWLLGATPKPWSEADSVLVLDAMFFDLNDSTNARELALARMKSALPTSVFEFLRADAGPWDAPLSGATTALPSLPPASDIDLRKLDPKSLKLADATMPPADVPGSNNFAVGGSLTDTGSAMVANDMHLHLGVPNLWFRARLRYPDPRHAQTSLDLTGVTLPGLPALVAGSNRRIAWAFTNSYGDWLDWVRVNLDAADQSRYRDANGWQPLEKSIEIIKVHNAPDEKLEVRETRWGPILANDADGTPLALAWTALQPGGVNLELLDLAGAETVDEALDIANRAGVPAQNFVVGDTTGDIGWTIAGYIPHRLGDCDPQLPCDWSEAGRGWDGRLDPDQYPRLKNPPSARLWTANSRTLDIDTPQYAKVGDGGYDLGARQGQIRDDLKAKATFAPADFLAIQLDDRALFLTPWHDRLRDALARADSPDLAEIKKYTDDWNGHADPKSVGYRLVRAFRLEVMDAVMGGFAAAIRTKYPDFRFPSFFAGEHQVEAILRARPAYLLPPGYSDWDDLLRQCARRVAARLAAQPGGLAARRWGEVTATHIDHPLSAAVPLLGRLIDMPTQELPGDGNMPRVQGASFGASERFGVQPGHEETGYFHMPGGQSGNPLSPFYGAGHEDWAQGKPTPFLPGETKYKLVLLPAG